MVPYSGELRSIMLHTETIEDRKKAYGELEAITDSAVSIMLNDRLYSEARGSKTQEPNDTIELSALQMTNLYQYWFWKCQIEFGADTVNEMNDIYTFTSFAEYFRKFMNARGFECWWEPSTTVHYIRWSRF